MTASQFTTQGSGTGTFHFNGGTLLPAASTTSFFQGVTTADVRNGGVKLDTNGFNVTVAQSLVHSTVAEDAATDGGLTKLGAGTLTLSGTNTYTGATNVNAGTLAVTGAPQGTSAVTVASGGTLTGTGTLSGPVNVQAGGTFSPGELSAGRLTLQSTLALSGSATAAFTLSGTGSTQALVAGQISLGTGTTLSLSLASGYSPAAGTKFYLLDETGTAAAVLGTFANAPLNGSLFTQNGVTFQINYFDHDPADTSNALFNDLSVTVVPEPSTWALLAAGAALLNGAVLRRRHSHAS